MYSYQKNSRYFAQVADDTKELAATELRNLGAKSVDLTYKGIYFNANQKDLYRINLQASLVHRVLAPLLTFDCHSDRYLYKTARQIRWLDFLTSFQTFAIFWGHCTDWSDTHAYIRKMFTFRCAYICGKCIITLDIDLRL